MAIVILSINAGSSSVKISVFKAEEKGQELEQLAETQIEGLTAPPATFTYERGSEKVKGQELGKNIESQDDAFKYMLDHLIHDKRLKEIAKKEDITYSCHRVVHGGDYDTSQEINQETFHHLQQLTELAPLHNASALAIVESCVKELPSTKNIAYFDSAFHASIPPHIKTYPIDQRQAKQKGLRKYGFHGISYAFILRQTAAFLKKEQKHTNILALHLGSGASACAIRNGRSLDTSMGVTPLAGLLGATRSGDVDPVLIFHFTSDAAKLSPQSTKEMHITSAEDILNKKSGWKALTGTTDFGKISGSDDPDCRLAFDIFVDRILGYLGSYYVKMHGEVDALVFAGGIGERSALLREKVTEGIQCLGFAVDEGKNQKLADGIVADVGQEGAKHRTLVCHTDEQYEMARACAKSAKY